jgi:hypothetical protein
MLDIVPKMLPAAAAIAVASLSMFNVGYFWKIGLHFLDQPFVASQRSSISPPYAMIDPTGGSGMANCSERGEASCL